VKRGEDDVGLLLVSGRRNKRLGYVEGHLSWKPRPMDTQSTDKKRPHTNTNYLPAWVTFPINFSGSLCSLETTKQRRESFSWALGCGFGWCQRSWVPSSYFFVPSCWSLTLGFLFLTADKAKTKKNTCGVLYSIQSEKRRRREENRIGRKK
jgi:hypothetical protein